MADSEGGGKVESECERQKGRGRARWLGERGGKEGERKERAALVAGPAVSTNVTAAKPQENAEGGGREPSTSRGPVRE